jgi:hypothetical protein
MAMIGIYLHFGSDNWILFAGLCEAAAAATRLVVRASDE